MAHASASVGGISATASVDFPGMGGASLLGSGPTLRPVADRATVPSPTVPAAGYQDYGFHRGVVPVRQHEVDFVTRDTVHYGPSTLSTAVPGTAPQVYTTGDGATMISESDRGRAVSSVTGVGVGDPYYRHPAPAAPVYSSSPPAPVYDVSHETGRYETEVIKRGPSPASTSSYRYYSSSVPPHHPPAPHVPLRTEPAPASVVTHQVPEYPSPLATTLPTRSLFTTSPPGQNSAHAEAHVTGNGGSAFASASASSYTTTSYY